MQHPGHLVCGVWVAAGRVENHVDFVDPVTHLLLFQSLEVGVEGLTFDLEIGAGEKVPVW